MTSQHVSRETSVPELKARVAELEAKLADLRTSRLSPTLVEYEGGFIQYPKIQFDSKPARRKAIGKNGRAFASIESCEAIPMSADNARWMLAATYGMAEAEGMLHRADQGGYIYGEKRELEGRQGRGKIRGGMNVAADQSRPGGYVIQVIAFVQGGIK